MKQQSESKLRLYLRLAVKLMLCVAVVAVLWVLLQATGEREEAQQQAPAVVFDVSDMKPGDVRTVVWANKPLLIARLLPEWQVALQELPPELLVDPQSQSSVQPAAAVNDFRSVRPGWFVAVGLGTAMGCPLNFMPPSEQRFQGRVWPGGLVDTCDASRFDLAGRVFRQQSARKNVVVPQWQLDDGRLMVGGQPD